MRAIESIPLPGYVLTKVQVMPFDKYLFYYSYVVICCCRKNTRRHCSSDLNILEQLTVLNAKPKMSGIGKCLMVVTDSPWYIIMVSLIRWCDSLMRACNMEFSPGLDDEDLPTDYNAKERLETIESIDETNSLEDTNSLGHRDSLAQREISLTANSYQDSTIDTGSSNSDGEDN